MGRHSIRWAILPHRGALSSLTVRAAHAFNNPLRPLSASGPAAAHLGEAPIRLVNRDDAQSLVLDVVKRGHDDDDVSRREGLRVREGRSVILRVYESLGGRSRGSIRTALDVKRVAKTNVLEDELGDVDMTEPGRFDIELRPFEVATYRLEL